MVIPAPAAQHRKMHCRPAPRSPDTLSYPAAADAAAAMRISDSVPLPYAHAGTVATHPVQALFYMSKVLDVKYYNTFVYI